MVDRVPISRVSKFLPKEEIEVLKDLYPDGRVQLWGTRIGGKDRNLASWSRLGSGDRALFYGGVKCDQNFFHTATIVHTLRSEALASDLWGAHSDGTHFELIYFVRDGNDCSIPLRDVNEQLGYAENNVLQGFTVLSSEKSTAFLKRFGESFGPAAAAEERARRKKRSVKDLRKLLADKDLDKKAETRSRGEQAILRAELLSDRDFGKCDLCGREFHKSSLQCAHIKPRSKCNNNERLDIENIAMLACVFGCDTLYEDGRVVVGADGSIALGNENEGLGDTELEYADAHLVGRACSAFTEGSSKYFAWHKENHGS